MEQDSRESKLAADAVRESQISFESISETVIKSKLMETNTDEMTDAELREFVKELERFV